MVFPTSPIVGQVFTSGGRSWVWNGSTWDSPRSDNPEIISGLQQVLYYTSSGTFTKATYPWLRAIRVKVVGGGGGGGGTSNGVKVNGGGGGGGGAYAESFITNISGMASTVTVTVGSGGAAGTNTVNAANGGNSSFGTAVVAGGGFGCGTLGPANNLNLTGAAGGNPSAGDLLIRGNIGGPGYYDSLTAVGGWGGSTLLSGTEVQVRSVSKNTGNPGVSYGGGGGGGANFTDTSTGASGGPGANGIVIVELYA
jgi:hypothetical protein